MVLALKNNVSQGIKKATAKLISWAKLLEGLEDKDSFQNQFFFLTKWMYVQKLVQDFPLPVLLKKTKKVVHQMLETNSALTQMKDSRVL